MTYLSVIILCGTTLLVQVHSQNWAVNFNNNGGGGAGCSSGSSDLEDVTNIFRNWNDQSTDTAPSVVAVSPQPGNEATTTFTSDAVCYVGGPNGTPFATVAEGIPCVEWYSAAWACGRRQIVNARNHKNTLCKETPLGYTCSQLFEIEYFFQANPNDSTNQAWFPVSSTVEFNKNKQITYEAFLISDRSINTGDSLLSHCNCGAASFPAADASPCPGPANNSE